MRYLVHFHATMFCRAVRIYSVGAALCLLSPLQPAAATDSSKIVDAPWRTTSVSTGITWRQFHFPDLYASWQSVNILDINNVQAGRTIAFAFVQAGFKKTSTFAQELSAIAAMNGGFFNTTTGGAVAFLKVNGQVINNTDSAFLASRPSNDEAAFIEQNTGILSIEKKPASGKWTDLPDIAAKRNILASGPLLLFAGALFPQENVAFNTARNPRSAVGLLQNGHLLFITVDGRTDSAAGMTTTELRATMNYLGCVFALNLDGGGSSTLYIEQQPFNGIVNYPCDNGIYDHYGERSVCNVICILGPTLLLPHSETDRLRRNKVPVTRTLFFPASESGRKNWPAKPFRDLTGRMVRAPGNGGKGLSAGWYIKD